MNSLFTPVKYKFSDLLYANNGMIVSYSLYKNGVYVLGYYDDIHTHLYQSTLLLSEPIDVLPALEVGVNFTKGKLRYIDYWLSDIPLYKVGKILYDCSQNTEKKQLYVKNYLAKENKEIYEKLFSEGKAHKISYMNNGQEEVSYMITENKHIMFA